MAEAFEIRFGLVCNICKRGVPHYALIQHLSADHGFREEFVKKENPATFYTAIPMMASWPKQVKQTKKKPKKKKKK